MAPIHGMMRRIQEVTRQLASLNSLQLPDGPLQEVRLIQLRRLARQIEASFPEHFGHGERAAHYPLLIVNTIGLPGTSLLIYMRRCSTTSDY
ncbi:MAG: hypothetical protein H0X01_00515 [Nitrospira sp.]|nr:hypothetical protein [Nitrospira sp.]